MRFFHQRRVGLVTPPANPAFEPELRAMLPETVATHATRLPVLPGGTLAARLPEYPPAYEAALASFGDLALEAFAIGLTGPSYALQIADDRALQARLSQAAGRPVVLPSLAIGRVLERLAIARVVIFSPYPGWLTEQAEGYWQRAGFEVAEVFQVSDTFRAYELTPEEVIAALERVQAPSDTAVILSGTGMATLDALAACQPRTGALLLPSNLATAFALIEILGVAPPPDFAALSPRLAAAL